MTQREIVIPGEVLDESGDLKPGTNTYKEGKTIYAQRLGMKRVGRGYVDVVALSGRRYDPQRGDLIIGTVAEVGPSNWYLEVNAPSQVGMHVNEVPWRVEFGETAQYLAIGDTVLLKVYHVDEMKQAQLTMKDRACRKLEGGTTILVQPSKVPRIIGRQGSMIETIKERTHCRIFVGKNGMIWLDGDPDDVTKAIKALRMIEADAHTAGLTSRVGEFLGAPIDGDDEWGDDDLGDEDSATSDETSESEFSDEGSTEESEDEDDDEDDRPDDSRGRGDRGESGGRGRSRGRRGGRGRGRGGRSRNKE